MMGSQLKVFNSGVTIRRKHMYRYIEMYTHTHTLVHTYMYLSKVFTKVFPSTLEFYLQFSCFVSLVTGERLSLCYQATLLMITMMIKMILIGKMHVHWEKE